MPRHARTKSSTNIYHIVIKGADSRLFFEEERDFRKYLQLLEYYKTECDFEIFAYCLMSNHVHLLIRHPNTISLSTIFRRLNTAYASWFNAKYNRTGYVQDGRYFSQPVETQEQLFATIRYIHYNPTKAGLENVPGGKYPWSSFYDYLCDGITLTDTSYILNLMGGKIHFFHFHNSNTPYNENFKCIDIESYRKQLPDDVAKQIIFDSCNCSNISEFEALSIAERNNTIITLHEKGLSIRQLNRLTGTPRGVIQRILS